MPEKERCAGCGVEIEGGSEGCQAAFDTLLGRDFTDARYFRVHRTMVDTYCLQHPDRYCASAKSLAAHLCGLCWTFEKGGGRAHGSEELQRQLNGRSSLVKPELPADRGPITIGDVLRAPDPEAYGEAVDRWARSTWAAYGDLHSVALRWLEGDEHQASPKQEPAPNKGKNKSKNKGKNKGKRRR